jgi:hypothetical protein
MHVVAWFGLVLVGAVPARGAATVEPQGADVHCAPQRPVANRPSPYDSTWIEVGARRALLCYSRPSARGRTMIGGERVPYGKLWRTGANEPTTLHLPFAANIAGIAVPAGSYSIYTVPDLDSWEIIVNRSTAQWGTEGEYTRDIQAQEVGRARVKPERLGEHVETFTITSRQSGTNGAEVVLDWEHTRVRIPLKRKV